ncbi:hypothetical protein WHH00_06325 [Pseudarthrobacter quantipunctorum]|uniref:Transposase for insertion sequence element IS21-like C-terminal domain-containing protein n=2 Tax=Pseudarthrobacter quantipunctorum TaxID=3128980 RepID=A0ABZ2RBT3_9MICC
MPYTYAGQLLRVRVTSTTVTVFDGDQVMCEHARRHSRNGQYSTHVVHAPTRHRVSTGCGPSGGSRTAPGPATEAVIAGIIDHTVGPSGS